MAMYTKVPRPQNDQQGNILAGFYRTSLMNGAGRPFSVHVIP